MTARIMVVEDEEAITVLLRYNLEAEGYRVEVVGRGDEAEVRLREAVPDLVLLDWMLPGLSGIELCRRIRLRPETERLPVIMLTARGEEGERVRGLATGADDYIVKPFSVPELLARVRALLRRAKPEHLSSPPEIRGYRARPRDTPRPSRRQGDQSRTDRVPPAGVPHAVAGPCLHPEQLLDGVWGRDVYIDERTVDVHIGRLRKAVKRGRETDPIRTVRGSGYSFNERFAGAAA